MASFVRENGNVDCRVDHDTIVTIGKIVLMGIALVIVGVIVLTIVCHRCNIKVNLRSMVNITPSGWVRQPQ
ncbi:Uncharacterized protein APZ42_013158 [Daphnia magna]|uniref:Uncharacterized protein n=1 Tax=Daphnia magna TaxID=35525 RepID=A0A162R1U4_9CRUS|nr:Uncharacterized protein APZ42_013158 [Daphnia magna]